MKEKEKEKKKKVKMEITVKRNGRIFLRGKEYVIEEKLAQQWKEKGYVRETS